MNTTRFSDTFSSATRFSPTCKRRLHEALAQVAASFLFLLLAGGLVGRVLPASAQSTTANQPENAEAASSEAASSVWQENFDEQIARQLRRHPSQRASFIQVVIAQASESEDLTLRRTADALLSVAENDPNRDHRLMAIQALSLFGSGHVAESQQEEIAGHLYALAQKEPSEKMRRSIADAISSYRAG
jgi:hypothetical protein